MRVIAVVLQQQAAFGALRRTLGISCFFPRYFRPIPSFCTQASSDGAITPADISSESEKESNEGEAKSNLSWRIEKLGRGESVASAFQSWMGDGLPILTGDIFHTINRLRRLKSAKRALEVMEWVIRERPYKPKELDYSYLLEFTMKHHGVAQGETLFTRIPSEFQNELLYNNLVLGCLDKGLIRLSLAYMKKMRELGHPISYLAFNRLIILHSSPTRRKSIPKILTQMKSDKTVRHVSTYNILLKIEANEHNIEGLVRVFGDMKRSMVEPNEITLCTMAIAHAVARLRTACEAYTEGIGKSMTGRNWSTLDILVILYGYLGKPKELERTWGVIGELPHVRSKSYVLAIEAFGKIGNLGRAEEVWDEMVSKKGLKSTEQFNSLIGVYCANGFVTKATGLYKEMEKSGCKPNSITFRHLALGCLRAGLVEEGIRTLELGMGFATSKKVGRSTPWLETTHSILEVFAENGDVENVEKLFEELKGAGYTRYTFVYNSLIKAYVKAKVYEPNLLRRMILGGCRPDSETYSLMKLIEQFRPG
ncbi:pentatricopeptide repeat-containing protein at1g07590 mitochondrial [Phtheirospermum japonicum]|uniref:Pentatricopeptide repeat-containing protein at1g07590 mitochondrial n=1 Tax=Phtheirospermum japonicum TaxID=374723 RepID=A0A830B5H9_9LAMI|nr:pentatricopeptide repeat-containing protein at1g07590 mitochondrial [Phtheirospermum japonicum]